MINDKETIIKDKVGSYVFSTEIGLPSKINLEFFGKNLMCDTLVDKDNIIIKDKFVKIESINLDHIPLPDSFLLENIKLITTDQKKITTNYIGFNGTVVIDFTKSNLFYQIAEFTRFHDYYY
jgi:hypothetical protein